MSDPGADVVAEIAAAGGEAVVNRDSVATPEGGEAIVQTALDTWGRVDVVVNNAGQVRMGPFADFPEAHLDTLLATQLRGSLQRQPPGLAGHGRARRRAVRERLVGLGLGSGRRCRLRHGEDGRHRADPLDGG